MVRVYNIFKWPVLRELIKEKQSGHVKKTLNIQSQRYNEPTCGSLY